MRIILLIFSFLLIARCGQQPLPKEDLRHVEVIDTPGWTEDELYQGISSWLLAEFDDAHRDIAFTNSENHQIGGTIYYEYSRQGFINVQKESFNFECRPERFQIRLDNPQMTSKLFNSLYTNNPLNKIKELDYVDANTIQLIEISNENREVILESLIEYLNTYKTDW